MRKIINKYTKVSRMCKCLSVTIKIRVFPLWENAKNESWRNWEFVICSNIFSTLTETGLYLNWWFSLKTHGWSMFWEKPRKILCDWCSYAKQWSLKKKKKKKKKAYNSSHLSTSDQTTNNPVHVTLSREIHNSPVRK